ncbi:MAG: hypothetical protein K0R20_2572 [Actinomycetia bacterium]|jgi:hypothetical protein|nr:hypothetical protein [Actinomycetes bacterium]
MSRVLRVALVVFGVVLVFVGLSAWGVEDMYGHGLNFTIAEEGGVATVYEEQTGQTPLFSGTSEEALDYVERRQATGKNFVVPGAIIAVGVVLVLVGLFVRRRMPD